MAFDSLYRQSMVDISESRIGEMMAGGAPRHGRRCV